MFEVIRQRLYANHDIERTVLCVVPTEDLAEKIVEQCEIRKSRFGYRDLWGTYFYEDRNKPTVNSMQEFLDLMGWKKEL